MYKEMINSYEAAKAKANALANALSSATSAEEKKKFEKDLKDAQKELSDLYDKIKNIEVESEFTLGQIVQGDDKTRITISVSPTDNTTFPAFNESGEEITTTHFGVSSRWFLALTSGICPVSVLILDQCPDIRKSIKPTLFSIFNGAKIRVVRKIALKGDKRKIGEGFYSSNQFILDRVLSLNVQLDIKDKFSEMRFNLWQAQLTQPYNEEVQQTAVSSLFKLC